jgi:hypothetical protein
LIEHMNISDFSIAELQEEIDRRAKMRGAGPAPLVESIFDKLDAMIRQGVAEAVKTGYWPKDFEHYVYEAAMESVYSKAFWTWRDSIDWGGE